MPCDFLDKKLILTVLAVVFFVSLTINSSEADYPPPPPNPYEGSVFLEITGVGNLTPNQSIGGNVNIVYNMLIPRDSVLNAYINNELVSTVSLYDYLHDPSDYSFEPQDFSYQIEGDGVTRWIHYPDQNFHYTIAASGTRWGNETPWGGCNDDNYVSEWFDEDTVNGSEGMKFIRDGSSTIFEPPGSNPDDTQWFICQRVPEAFDVMVRAACGGQTHFSFSVDPDGFVRRRLLCSQQECDNGVCTGDYCSNSTAWNREGTTISRDFPESMDTSSLDEPNRDLYWDESEGWGLPGGIYRNISGNVEYQNYDVDVYWEELESGTYIEIRNYDYQSRYEIVYFPPNGPMVCAHTDVSEEHAQDWDNVVSGVYNESVWYDYMYVSEYQYPSTLPSGPPCPPSPNRCIERNPYNYITLEVSDPSNAVDIQSDYNTGGRNLTVTATTDSTEFEDSENETDTVSLDAFSGLESPGTGSHILTLELVDPSGIMAASSSVSFIVCIDSDSDGYCSTGEGGNDCNDTNQDVYPGGTEICNGADDDCDGDIDEDFRHAGSVLGNQCGVGACEGIFVCTSDGSDTVCSNTLEPGYQQEICSNNIDDDCDGITDEEFEPSGAPGCVCNTGDTDLCGSNIGICEAGTMACVNGVWSNCIGGVNPRTETCNRLDDDCDGTIDDINNLNSVEATQCRCYGGGSPTEETCNDIDDDCDGNIDEGIRCCTDGDTRQCPGLGACNLGTQRCIDGLWSSCNVNPIDEICYNDIDDNCDGEADEDCSPEFTCNNRIKDLNEGGVDCGGPCPNICEIEIPWTLLITAGIVIIVVLAVLVIYFRSKGGKLTWEELRRKWTPASP